MFAQHLCSVLTAADAEPVVAAVQRSSHASFLLLPVAELYFFAYLFPAAEVDLVQSA